MAVTVAMALAVSVSVSVIVAMSVVMIVPVVLVKYVHHYQVENQAKHGGDKHYFSIDLILNENPPEGFADQPEREG